MDETQLAQHAELHDRLGRLIHRTLLSLLRFYDGEERFFHSRLDLSVQAAKAESPKQDAVTARPSTPQTDADTNEWGPAKASDTATLLLAIEHAEQAMQRGEKSSDSVNIQAAISKSLKELHIKGKVAPISYEFYKKVVFDPCLTRIAGSKAFDDILDPKPQGKSWETFNACRTLALLHKYPDEKTHQALYVKVLDVVLRAVTHPYPPHYLFGGASLSGTESHAFTSHECLTTLADLGTVLEQRAKEHKILAELVSNIHSWCSDPNSAVFRIHNLSFQDFLEDRLNQLKNPVGLSPMAQALRKCAKKFPDSSDSATAVPRPATKTIAEKMVEAIGKQQNSRKSVRLWLRDFSGLVSGKIDELEAAIKDDGKALETHFKAVNGKPDDGANSIGSAPIYVNMAGLRWTKAFFEGMRHVLSETERIYATLVTDRALKSDKALITVSKAIEKAGAEWELSARRTREYLGKLSRWTEAEIQRQLTLRSLDKKTNFDSAQLAFALGAYNRTALSPNSSLVEKALEIVFEAQLPDGTWPVGAPFSFDRNSVATNNNSNLEIMNALIPMITRKRLGKYRQHADWVFAWLEANMRELVPPSAKSGTEYPLTGWSTDRISEAGRIDSWMTAAALHFLVFYRKLLQDDVNEHLAQSYDYKRPKMTWHSIIDSQLCVPYERRITTRIYKEFITPFKRTGSSPRSAMVLHGPPGTAKTTFAEAIATELGWDMFTITPSDFVKNGIEKSEASARTLFKEISQLREAVVFFDEIDEMLRDRQDEKSQGGVAMLRFLIPGMLPKLQALKQYGEKNKLIFIVATNYMDRLDAAITRTGRIDEKFAVVPPDSEARYCLLKGFLESKRKSLSSTAENESLEKQINSLANLEGRAKDLRKQIRKTKQASSKLPTLRKKKTQLEKQIEAAKKKLFAEQKDLENKLPGRVNTLTDFLAKKTAGWVYKELELLVETLAATKAFVDKVPQDQQQSLDALEAAYKAGKLSIVVKEPDDFKNVKAENEAIFANLARFKICGRSASLNLANFYAKRPKADPEIVEVLKSYGIGTDRPGTAKQNDEAKTVVRAILQDIEASEEQIMKALAGAISSHLLPKNS